MFRQLIIAIAIDMIVITKIHFIKRRRCETWCLLIFSTAYVIAVVYLTLLRRCRDSLVGVSIKWPLPFLKALIVGRYRATTNRSVLNLLLFIPFGCLYSRFYCKYLAIGKKCSRHIRAAESGIKHKRLCDGIWKAALAGFAASLLIETLQLILHRGVFEIDDLVKNTIGTVVGYLFCQDKIEDKTRPEKA